MNGDARLSSQAMEVNTSTSEILYNAPPGDPLSTNYSLAPNTPINQNVSLQAKGAEFGKVGGAYLDLLNWTTLWPKLAMSSRKTRGSSTSKLNP